MKSNAHGEGRYQCSEDTDNDGIALKYNNNPNGSIADIAGMNPAGNVLGLTLNGPVIQSLAAPMVGG